VRSSSKNSVELVGRESAGRTHHLQRLAESETERQPRAACCRIWHGRDCSGMRCTQVRNVRRFARVSRLNRSVRDGPATPYGEAGKNQPSSGSPRALEVTMESYPRPTRILTVTGLERFCHHKGILPGGLFRERASRPRGVFACCEDEHPNGAVLVRSDHGGKQAACCCVSLTRTRNVGLTEWFVARSQPGAYHWLCLRHPRTVALKRLCWTWLP
jgi:hypothetical protein